MDDILSVEVSTQEKTEYSLVQTFEVSSDDDGHTKKKWPWFHSGVYFATANPATEEEWKLLRKTIESLGSNGNISDEARAALYDLDSSRYSDSTTRITKEFLIARLEELDQSVRNLAVPCAKVIRLDSKQNKINSVKNAKIIAVSTRGLNSQHTFRVQMSGSSYLDLHFDKDGNYAGCAFLCGDDIIAKTKFPDNYMSEGFNKGALKGIIKGLDGFTVNGDDIRSKILESLEAAKTPEQVSKDEANKQREGEKQRTDEDTSPTKKSHTKGIVHSTGISVDLGCVVR